MIEQTAKVIASDDNTVWLEAETQSTCSQCQIKKGCGTGMLAKHVGKRFSQIAVHKERDVQIGDEVQVGISEQALLLGAFMMYIVPLLMLFGFALLARFYHLGELMEIFAAACGLILGFFWVHIRMRRTDTTIQAKIVEGKK